MFKDLSELENISKKALRSGMHDNNNLKWLKAKGRINKGIKKNYLLLPE
jgi:Ca2+-binding EF-hand superfamily protein